jgi:quercetin dioxygenase-like cupin family protein
MTDTHGNIPPRPARRTPGHEQVSERLGRAVAHIDLDAEIELLRGEPSYDRAGRNAKTLVKRTDFRVVLTAIRRGTRIAEHLAAGPLTVQTVRGRIRMRVPSGEAELGPGHMLTLERNERHDVEALEDSAFLLTIAWPEGH